MERTERRIKTGIFETVEYAPANDPGAFVASMVQALDNLPTLEQVLAAARQRASAVLEKHGLPPDGSRVPGDSAGSAVVEQCNEASMVCSYVQKLTFVMTDASPDQKAAVLLAYYLGCIDQRLQVRPFERAASTGQKQLDGASKGGKVHAPSLKEIAAAVAEFGRLKAHGMKADEAAELVGQAHGVRRRTIYRWARESTVNAPPCQ